MTGHGTTSTWEPRGPTWEDGPLTVTDFVRYQGASGDMNPIHHDTEFAQKAGFPKPFAVGMRQAGVLASWATDWLGPANVRRFKVQWREQAWPGDVLTYSGAVIGQAGRGRAAPRRRRDGRHPPDRRYPPERVGDLRRSRLTSSW